MPVPATTHLLNKLYKVRALCDEESLQGELVFLMDIFKQNGYNNWQIHTTSHCCLNFGQLDNKPNKPNAF
jgi:hypothetical protein